MASIFLDVGAHVGQTLKAVRDLPFDRIHCFEPVPQHWPVLKMLGNERTHVERFGLWDVDAKLPVHAPGTMGASLWEREGRMPIRTVCEFRRASHWLQQNTDGYDTVYMKLNCEGAELGVLDDLMRNNEMPSFTLVMFDAHKIPELHSGLAATRERLLAYPKPRVLSSKEIPVGATHEERIRNWLTLVGFQ